MRTTLLCGLMLLICLPLSKGQEPAIQFAPSDSTRIQQDKSATAAPQGKQASSDQKLRQLQQDTDKLLQLSVELKQGVDHTDENVLSLKLIKKAEQIEKMAHEMRDRVRSNR